MKTKKDLLEDIEIERHLHHTFAQAIQDHATVCTDENGAVYLKFPLPNYDPEIDKTPVDMIWTEQVFGCRPWQE